MWAALAVSALLSAAPADAGALQVKNDRFTYGVYGQTRADARVLPGDILIMAFDIDGLQTKEDGTVSYSTAMELLDKNGKSVFTEKPIDRVAMLTLGGGRLPNWSRVATGTDADPGTYTVRVTVVDKGAKNAPQAVVEKKFELLTPGFGIIRTQLASDKPPASPPPAPPLGAPGQGMMAYFTLAGFQTAAGKKIGELKTDLVVQMDIVDDTGKSTLAKPFGGDVDAVAEQNKTALDLNFPLTLNRGGKFTIVITATDKLANKTAKQELSLTVLDVK